LKRKSPIENWELRICYLLLEEAELAPLQISGGQAFEPIINNKFSILNFQ